MFATARNVVASDRPNSNPRRQIPAINAGDGLMGILLILGIVAAFVVALFL